MILKFVTPMAAQSVKALPEGDEWLYEPKLDDYRSRLLKDGERAGHWGGGITADEMQEMRWTKPQLVAQVRFTEWTVDNRLRHAAFLGLRSDKSAKDVRKES